MNFKNILRSLPIQAKWYEDKTAPGIILSLEPLVVFTTIGYPDPTAYVRAYAANIGKRPALFIIYMSWILTPGKTADRAIEEFKKFQKANANIKIIYTCNEASEVNVLKSYSVESYLLNHNMTVSEEIFYPIETHQKFDAIYNARITPLKQIELGFSIDRYACITVGYEESDATYAKKIIQDIHKNNDKHRILNTRDHEKFVYMTAEDVNKAYAMAHVGLCLSSVEGAMLSSMEYLLAGLPVVTVPNVGGRNHYFDAEYCIEVRPDQLAIKEAVEELKLKKIPKSYIRQKTIEKIKVDRLKFIEMLNSESMKKFGANIVSTGESWPWRRIRNFCLTNEVWGSVDLSKRDWTLYPTLSSKDIH